MVAHIPMDYAVTRHAGDIEGSGISLTTRQTSWQQPCYSITVGYYVPRGALERKLDMAQRNDPQPSTDKQKIPKLDP